MLRLILLIEKYTKKILWMSWIMHEKGNEVMWFCLEMSWIMHVKVNIINRKVYKRNIMHVINNAWLKGIRLCGFV
jgi:hypothetical protein